MKFSIKDFFSKCDQIRSKLPFWSYLQKESLIENFVFCALAILQETKRGVKRQVHIQVIIFQKKWLGDCLFTEKINTGPWTKAEVFY